MSPTRNVCESDETEQSGSFVSIVNCFKLFILNRTAYKRISDLEILELPYGHLLKTNFSHCRPMQNSDPNLDCHGG